LFLHEDIDEKVDNAFVTGYWHFCHKHPEAAYLEPGLVRRRESDRTAFLGWFRRHKPDVVVSIGGLGIVRWLEELDRKVPRDVGYVRLSVGKDESFYSGIYENGVLIGKTAVDFLVGMLQRGEYGFPETPIRILVEGTWRTGKSVRSMESRSSRRPAALA
jgi:LacI family transcriptional regulator